MKIIFVILFVVSFVTLASAETLVESPACQSKKMFPLRQGKVATFCSVGNSHLAVIGYQKIDPQNPINNSTPSYMNIKSDNYLLRQLTNEGYLMLWPDELVVFDADFVERERLSLHLPASAIMRDIVTLENNLAVLYFVEPVHGKDRLVAKVYDANTGTFSSDQYFDLPGRYDWGSRVRLLGNKLDQLVLIYDHDIYRVSLNSGQFKKVNTNGVTPYYTHEPLLTPDNRLVLISITDKVETTAIDLTLQSVAQTEIEIPGRLLFDSVSHVLANGEILIFSGQMGGSFTNAATGTFHAYVLSKDLKSMSEIPNQVPHWVDDVAVNIGEDKVMLTSDTGLTVMDTKALSSTTYATPTPGRKQKMYPLKDGRLFFSFGYYKYVNPSKTRSFRYFVDFQIYNPLTGELTNIPVPADFVELYTNSESLLLPDAQIEQLNDRYVAVAGYPRPVIVDIIDRKVHELPSVDGKMFPAWSLVLKDGGDAIIVANDSTIYDIESGLVYRLDLNSWQLSHITKLQSMDFERGIVTENRRLILTNRYDRLTILDIATGTESQTYSASNGCQIGAVPQGADKYVFFFRDGADKFCSGGHIYSQMYDANTDKWSPFGPDINVDKVERPSIFILKNRQQKQMMLMIYPGNNLLRLYDGVELIDEKSLNYNYNEMTTPSHLINYIREGRLYLNDANLLQVSGDTILVQGGNREGADVLFAGMYWITLDANNKLIIVR